MHSSTNNPSFVPQGRWRAGQAVSHGAFNDGESQRADPRCTLHRGQRTNALDMIEENAKPGSTVDSENYDIADLNAAACLAERHEPPLGDRRAYDQHPGYRISAIGAKGSKKPSGGSRRSAGPRNTLHRSRGLVESCSLPQPTIVRIPKMLAVTGRVFWSAKHETNSAKTCACAAV